MKLSKLLVLEKLSFDLFINFLNTLIDGFLLLK